MDGEKNDKLRKTKKEREKKEEAIDGYMHQVKRLTFLTTTTIYGEKFS